VPIDEQLRGRRLLHHLAQVHAGDVVGEILDHAQVVGDEYVCRPHLPLQLLEQVQDLSLDGYVQGGDRLVADDELGVHRQGPGDADALAAAAVQLVGEGVDKAPGQSHDVHQLQGPLLNVRPALEQLVLLDGLADEPHDALPGVQGGEGILEDHLHLRAHGAHTAAAVIGDVRAVEDDLTCGGLQKLENGAAGGGLAAAALAHDAQGLSLLNGEVHAVHSEIGRASWRESGEGAEVGSGGNATRVS